MMGEDGHGDGNGGKRIFGGEGSFFLCEIPIMRCLIVLYLYFLVSDRDSLTKSPPKICLHLLRVGRSRRRLFCLCPDGNVRGRER